MCLILKSTVTIPRDHQAVLVARAHFWRDQPGRYQGARMFHIEETLRKKMKVDDDQHGTAIVSGAALLNALEVVGKLNGQVRVVVQRRRRVGDCMRGTLCAAGREATKTSPCAIQVRITS